MQTLAKLSDLTWKGKVIYELHKTIHSEIEKNYDKLSSFQMGMAMTSALTVAIASLHLKKSNQKKGKLILKKSKIFRSIML